jgi:predicted DNA-binding transcriptional regulator AlpA
MVDITQTTYLSADDICSRLSVSRSTFDRWRKITGTPSPFGAGSGFQTKVNSAFRSVADVEDDVGLTPFPQPAMNVGGSPRWAADEVNAWLVKNKDKKNRRGFGLGAD